MKLQIILDEDSETPKIIYRGEEMNVNSLSFFFKPSATNPTMYEINYIHKDDDGALYECQIREDDSSSEYIGHIQ